MLSSPGRTTVPTRPSRAGAGLTHGWRTAGAGLEQGGSLRPVHTPALHVCGSVFCTYLVVEHPAKQVEELVIGVVLLPSRRRIGLHSSSAHSMRRVPAWDEGRQSHQHTGGACVAQWSARRRSAGHPSSCYFATYPLTLVCTAWHSPSPAHTPSHTPEQTPSHSLTSRDDSSTKCCTPPAAFAASTRLMVPCGSVKLTPWLSAAWCDMACCGLV